MRHASVVAAVCEAQARQGAASRDDRRLCSSLDIGGGHRPPLQMKRSHHPFLGSVLCLLCTFPDLLGKAATLLKNVLQRELHNPRIQRISDLPESVDGQAESEYRSSSRDERRTKTVGHVVRFNTNFQSPSF